MLEVDWRFIADVDLRDQCDHVWVMEFNAYDDGRFVRAERRCEREGKYQNGDHVRCGFHTPGVGRKGTRRVPKDRQVDGKATVRLKPVTCEHKGAIKLR